MHQRDPRVAGGVNARDNRDWVFGVVPGGTHAGFTQHAGPGASLACGSWHPLRIGQTPLRVHFSGPRKQNRSPSNRRMSRGCRVGAGTMSRASAAGALEPPIGRVAGATVGHPLRIGQTSLRVHVSGPLQTARAVSVETT